MNDRVLRVIDANANRAREALRVVEDYARFVLDDPALCAGLKHLRHDLASALQPVIADAILNRDTPGDGGTAVKTPSELRRQDAADVVTAAGKRLGEALRTLEEFSKTIDPAMASRIESLRYRFYDIEQRIALTLHRGDRFANVRLCVLITESLCRRPWIEAAEESIEGGADCLQLREKGLEGSALLGRARTLVETCRRRGVLCIINDRPDIATLAQADGVHVGQQDLPARDVRKLVGREMIVGVSTHSIEQATQAVLDSADYIGVGPLFRSSTKPRDFLPGLDYARQVARQIRIPALGIAGIDQANVDEVISTGLRAIAVSSAVIGADDPRDAARRLKCRLQESETGCPTS